MKYKILGIAGSLREGSFNRKLLNVAIGLTPDDVEIEVCDIANIPVYNQDLEIAMPDAVSIFKDKVRSSDGILFVTPEYNYSVPGVLKNAIDWASRPFGDNSWDGKPVAIMGATIGGMGTVRAQLVLRQSFVFLNMPAVLRPEVFLSFADKAFDEKDDLKDSVVKDRIRQLIESLIKQIEMNKSK